MDNNPTSNLKPGFDANAGDENKTALPPQLNNTQGILDQTLGQIITDNPEAKEMLMRAMHVTPEQFQALLAMTQDDKMMNTKVSDLFQNGTIQRALEQQGMPMQGVGPTGEQVDFAENVKVVPARQQMSSMFNQLKKLFGFRE